MDAFQSAPPPDWPVLHGAALAALAGVGVDTIRTERLRRGVRQPTFLARVFGPQENAALSALPLHRRIETAAAAWAAKEALGKALGSGLAAFALAQAQVLHTEDGAPYFAFSGALEQQMAAAGLQVLLSLTHEGGFATAFVVLVRQPREGTDDPS